MALTDENGGSPFTMPVQPMGGYGYGGFPMMGNYGGMGFGGDWMWVVLLLLLGGNGWGGFGGFGGFGGMMGLGFDFPWLLNGQNQINANTNAGFDHAATQSALGNLSTAVTAGFGDVQLGIAGVNQNICQTGNGITAAITGAQNAIAQQLYSNEINSLNRSFAEQTANTAAVNGVSRQLADCCCENRLATQALQSTVISENCADREALSNGIRDIITAQTAGTQRILDMLCQNKIDEQAQTISELRTQVQMQNLAASQAAQTAALVADNTAQTQYIVNRVAPYPIPAFQVGNPYGYGGYYGYNGCGCNGNGFGFAG